MDFTEIIRAYMAEGHSTDDIAEAFSKSLNKVEDTSDFFVKDALEVAQDAIEEGYFDLMEAAMMAATYIAEVCPEMTANELDQFTSDAYDALLEVAKDYGVSDDEDDDDEPIGCGRVTSKEDDEKLERFLELIGVLDRTH